jgi:hypothetical protein
VLLDPGAAERESLPLIVRDALVHGRDGRRKGKRSIFLLKRYKPIFNFTRLTIALAKLDTDDMCSVVVDRALEFSLVVCPVGLR